MNKNFKYYLLFTLITLILVHYLNPFNIFVLGNELSFISIVIACITIEFFIRKAKNGDEIYLNVVMDYVPETVFRILKHYNKMK